MKNIDLRISNLKITYRHSEEELRAAIAKKLHCDPKQIETIHIIRRSLDCRKKPQLYYVYTLDVRLISNPKLMKRLDKMQNVRMTPDHPYTFIADGTEELKYRPVIIGAGPSGLFCALELARAGFKPIIIERGQDVVQRQKDVNAFWNNGQLQPESNVQYGEGGAGTFSDGKLNTMVKDKGGLGRQVLSEFVKFGADEKILYEAKPHVGTDVLSSILVNMRDEIISLGGEYLFGVSLKQIVQADETSAKIILSNGKEICTQVLVLAIGNSARDTFEMLYDFGLEMEAKAFAIGFRVEHPQEMIDLNAYGMHADEAGLEAASYKLTEQVNHRGIYSFCMCPGGYVVNASSEAGRLAVNGMSYHDRNSANANSAIVVTVGPEDFGSDGPLSGIAYQRSIEEKAFSLADGSIPQQRFGDFCRNTESKESDAFPSMHKGKADFANLRTLFSEKWNEDFIEAMHLFGKKIPGFDRPDAILSAVESRTSSPVKIVRNEAYVSANTCIYPCGEGAGYAGGIVSAGMDGLRVAQQIAHKYQRMED